MRRCDLLMKSSALSPSRITVDEFHHASADVDSRLGEVVRGLMADALLDADHHALAVDVCGLERRHLGRAQASAVSHAERRLVLEPRRRRQETRDLLRAQNDGKLVGLADEWQMARDI